MTHLRHLLERQPQQIERLLNRLKQQLAGSPAWKDVLLLARVYQDQVQILLSMLNGYSRDIMPTMQRKVKPRLSKRDAEIVRLRDKEHKSFGQIPRLLMQIDPRWSKNGKPLPRHTVEVAYFRAKAKLSQIHL